MALFVNNITSAVTLLIIRNGNAIMTKIKNATIIALTVFLMVNRNRALNGNAHMHSRCTAIMVVTKIRHVMFSISYKKGENVYIYISINEIFVNIIKKGNINLIFQVTFLNIYSYRRCDINVHCSTYYLYTFPLIYT